jgi:hypothetical protein
MQFSTDSLQSSTHLEDAGDAANTEDELNKHRVFPVSPVVSGWPSCALDQLGLLVSNSNCHILPVLPRLDHFGHFPTFSLR